MEWYNTQDREMTDFNKIDMVEPTLNKYAQRDMENACAVSMLHHITQVPHQTGQAKTGMVKRLNPGSNAPSLTLIY